MTTEQEYKYEVAFSFLRQDEGIAFDLNDRIQDRLSTFIYSKKQEELGGTDGEKKFNKVFYEQSRVVVVLYRDGWGQTAWTRIEETAIKNRAFDKGWDFLLLINLDNNSTLPSWIPKTYIWLDYERYKTEGAIAVIEQKVKEAGGQARQETIGDRAERLKRLRTAEKAREEFLKSQDAITAANQEILSLLDKFKKTKQLIEDPSTHLHLASSERPNPPMYELGHDGYFLCFNNSSPFGFHIYAGSLTATGTLRVTLYEKSGHYPFDYKENIHKKVELKFDRDLIGNNGWSDYDSGKNFLTTDELLDKWVKKFIDDIGKRKKNNR